MASVGAHPSTAGCKVNLKKYRKVNLKKHGWSCINGWHHGSGTERG
jgi:hypothetical protein